MLERLASSVAPSLSGSSKATGRPRRQGLSPCNHWSEAQARDRRSGRASRSLCQEAQTKSMRSTEYGELVLMEGMQVSLVSKEADSARRFGGLLAKDVAMFLHEFRKFGFRHFHSSIEIALEQFLLRTIQFLE